VVSNSGDTGTAGQVLAVLGRYLSTINANNVLARALRDSRLGGVTGPDDVRRIQPALERGLRLFLPHSSVGAALTELAREFAGPPPTARTIYISVENDVSVARVTVRDMCEQLGARSVVMQKVATVVSELARNIFMYTPGGTIELEPVTDTRPPRLTVRAIDRGTGIANLEEVLAGRYKSRTGLGHGLLGTKRLVDRFHIDTGPHGTRIEIGVDL
jgi:serine/threonine-protein kinase RsbT